MATPIDPSAARFTKGLSKCRVLLVDDDDLMRDSVGRTLIRGGFDIVACNSGDQALRRMAEPGRYDLLLTDLKMPGMNGIELLAEAQKIRPELPIVLMTAFASVKTAVQAMQRGAHDYIQKPFEKDDLLRVVGRTIEHARLKKENTALKIAVREGDGSRPMIGKSMAMERVRRTVEQVATSAATVLIRGESGTGKEVVARLIHHVSPRSAKPFLAVNCAALSEHLLESELFGHEKGAFTGADSMRQGRFELADGGTLLLDEISEIPPSLQAKLLRVLQEQSFERVGGSVTHRVDVRLIATSNRDLEQAVASGDFREDLFYRLNVVPVKLPALRDRTEDIPDLVRHFLRRIAGREGQQLREMDPAAMTLLQRYPWPGNVRELQNIIERAAVLETDPECIRVETVSPWLADLPEQSQPSGGLRLAATDPLETIPLAEVEKRVILETLSRFEGHRAKTATALGIGLRTLGIKLKKWKEEGVISQAA